MAQLKNAIHKDLNCKQTSVKQIDISKIDKVIPYTKCS